MKRIAYNVYRKGNKLYTKALIDRSVYGEKLLRINGITYREWVAKRSKLSAAIMNGLKEIPIKKDSKVLYLGAASGTTISHVSDIAEKGEIYGVEFSPIVGVQLMALSRERKNIVPIISDASLPQKYESIVPVIDIVFQDIAQRHQVDILKKNCKYFLKKNGIAMIAVKARSIDVSKKPRDIFRRVRKELEKDFEILQELRLEPYEKDHSFFLLRM